MFRSVIRRSSLYSEEVEDLRMTNDARSREVKVELVYCFKQNLTGEHNTMTTIPLKTAHSDIQWF